MGKNKKNIRECIREKGYKIKALAALVSLSPTHFSKKIDTPWKLTIEELITIARALQVDYTSLDIGMDF